MKKLNLDRSDFELFAWCLSEGFEQNRVVYAYDNSPIAMAISAKIKKICQEVTTLTDWVWTDFQVISKGGTDDYSGTKTELVFRKLLAQHRAPELEGKGSCATYFHGKASGKKDKWVRCKLIENPNPNAGLGAARTMTGSSASSMAAAHHTMVGAQQHLEALDDDGEGWVSTSPSASQLRPTSAAAAAV
uniref:Uncharacterized protein n=1 Tax=Chromera velia CCMP2878 TaxID=1169474 RepID=A0A0G4FDD0_9ALVE|eukprot:Cvel_16465.t2-p1 / transcript=Cvel_16465.t2 / gene=Cvel_16465 / organism=Chromera_velia_CCMP2878 / gene_product=hypothetical protein / transcript_product=hypothetical protein / location=Cvel_scaffold1269:16836-18065(-) / protein_length=188 / sequence_SO=supercontig / SO=protein_coding / is_pseudo=false